MRTTLALSLLIAVAPAIASAGDFQQTNPGLIGKGLFQASYLNLQTDTPTLRSIDKSFDGVDSILNLPLDWLPTNQIATDLYASHEYLQMSGANGVFSSKIDTNYSTIGLQFAACPTARIRPLVGLGVSYFRGQVEITNAGTTTSSPTIDEFGPELRLGVEADLMKRLSARAQFNIAEGELDNSRFEGTGTFWFSETWFMRGGVVVPFEDELSTGAMIGGGCAF